MKKIILIFFCIAQFFLINIYADNGSEFGVEDDLIIYGSTGTFLDPDVEIKGFSVFGSTQSTYPGNIPYGTGNVIINGYLSVSSGSYFVGNSTFTNINNIFINDGTAGYYIRKNAGGYLEWANPSTIGDNLGDHVATMTLTAVYGINVSSINITGTNVTGSQELLKIANSTMVVLNNGHVGIGTTSPGAKLDVVGQVKIVDGTQGANKVLTSDANGLASWTTFSAPGDNLGNHIATMTLNMSGFNILSVSTITVSTVTTTNTGVTFSTNVYIATGKLGIGTTNPCCIMDIKQTYGIVSVSTNGAQPGTFIDIIHGLYQTADILNVGIAYSGDVMNVTTNGTNFNQPVSIKAWTGDYAFFVDQGSTGGVLDITKESSNHILTIPNSGFVGIGTNVPQTALHIVGTTTVTGFINVKSTAGYAMNGYTILRSSDVLYGTFVGREAGSVNTGNNNSFMGYYAGYNNTIGTGNSFMGVEAGYSNDSGVYNSFIGYNAGYYNQTGSENTISGYRAGGYGSGAVNSFSNSTIMGSQAGYKLAANANGNILLGYKAGYDISTGTGNIVIGFDQDTPLDTSNNTLNIGGLIYGTGLVAGGSGGNVGIGTKNPEYSLDIYKKDGPAFIKLQGDGNTYNFSGFILSSNETTSKYWGIYHRKPSSELNNLLFEEFDGTNYKERIVLTPDGLVAFNNSTSKTQFELQGIGDTYNYTSLIFWNHDWTKYWSLMHRKDSGEINNFFIEEYDGTNYNARLAILPGGNIGIGTTSPGAKLDVQNGSIKWGHSYLNDDQDGSIELGNSLSSGLTPFIDFHYGTGSTQDNNVRIINDGNGKLSLNAPILYASGNVGIGTASPGEKLDVSGGIKVSSGIVAGAWVIGGCTNPNDPNDIMVAVGDFCVDKYEASVWSTPTGGTQYGSGSDNYLCNDNGQDCATTNKIYARSVSGITPSRYITWFQANMACINSGKHLLTNAEWQAAASGTTDPGTTGTEPNCNISGTAPSTTGGDTGCVSAFGVENMIGSLWEWVADWGTAGAGASNSEGTFIEFDGTGTGYNNDGNWNIGGKAYTNAPNPEGWITGIVPAVIRGGGWGDGVDAGVFAFSADHAPSLSNPRIGFRCGRRR